MAVTVPVFAVPVHPLPAVAVRLYVRVELTVTPLGLWVDEV